MMNAAAYLGRVGGLAVALGVGVALVTGNGCAVAWADTPSSSDSSSNAAGPGRADSPGAAGGVPGTPEADDAGPAAPESGVASPAAEAPESGVPDSAAGAPGVGRPAARDTESTSSSTSSTATTSQARPGVAISTGGAITSSAEDDITEPTEEVTETAPTVTSHAAPRAPQRASSSSDSQPDGAAGRSTPSGEVAAADVKRHASSKATAPAAREAAPPPISPLAAQSVSPAITPQAVTPTGFTLPEPPSLRLWPTAFDPLVLVSYVGNLASSILSAAFSPFSAGAPALPSDLWPWTVLAWMRRQLFNESPTITYDPAQNSQGFNPDGDVVITGNIGAVDPDGDPLTYTVIGTPLNGGTVKIDQHGNFIYRPMNAMAAVGGTDQFTVVVTDEDAGLHAHGPFGFLQFVPILGQFVNPGSGHGVAKTITVDVTEVPGVDLSFPVGFRWGVAHAGFQAEGGPGSPVDPNSDWYRWVHDPINQLLGLTKGVPENGPGTYVMYEEDAVLAREELGMNTFRMGIEWSRIFPNSTASVDISDEGGVVSLADLEALDALANQEEVTHYRDVFTSLRNNFLEPVVTVNHFTLPVWVHDPTTTRLLGQVGLPAPATGWLSPTTPVEFEKYAAYVAWKYGDQIDTWVVLNEPFPPMLTQYFTPPIPGFPAPYWPPGIVRPDLAATYVVNEAKGYVRAYDAIHAWDTTVATAGQPAASVGFANHMIPARPANPVNALDVQAATLWTEVFNRWFPNAVIDGWVDANLDGIKTPDEIHPEMADKADFLAVQYYGSQPITGLGIAPLPGLPWLQGLPSQCAEASPACSDFGQTIDPGGFREVLDIAASYGKPIWVTENGIADDDDTKRPSYLANHIAVVQDQIAHGMDIRGYIVWSFVDNLEWSGGYHLVFGIYGSDPTTPELERTPKPDTIAVLNGIATLNSLPPDILEQYIPRNV